MSAGLEEHEAAQKAETTDLVMDLTLVLVAKVEKPSRRATVIELVEDDVDQPPPVPANVPPMPSAQINRMSELVSQLVYVCLYDYVNALEFCFTTQPWLCWFITS